MKSISKHYENDFLIFHKIINNSIMGFQTCKEYMMGDREGILGQTVPGLGYFPTTEENEAIDWPDIQITFASMLIGKHTETKAFFNMEDKYWYEYIEPAMKGKEGISMLYALLRPKSR